jgi:hypothetical protein
MIKINCSHFRGVCTHPTAPTRGETCVLVELEHHCNHRIPNGTPSPTPAASPDLPRLVGADL